MASIRRSTLAISASLLALVASEAKAQIVDTPPVYQSIDENGVDLSRGTVSVSSADISIGSGPSELKYVRTQIDNDVRSNLIGSLDSDGNIITVSIGSFSETFTVNGNTFTSNQAKGSTLTFDSATNQYTYTDSNGVISIFKQANGTAQEYGSSGYILSTEAPDGNKVNFNVATGQWCPETNQSGGSCTITPSTVSRVQSVTNNSGYQLKLEYASNSIGITSPQLALQEWYRVTKVTAINNGIEYCNPTADSCTLTWGWPSVTYAKTGTVETLTDAANNQWTKTVDGNGKIVGLRRPTSTVDTTVIAYGTDGKVQSVAREGLSTSYVWSGTSGSTTLTKTNSSGLIQTIVTNADGQMTSSSDNLGRNFAYAYDNGRLSDVTYPEGNKEHYIYDLRGNVIEQSRKAKPGSSLVDTVTRFGFDSVCGNVKTCNKPRWMQDANTADASDPTKLTEYFYDETTGQPSWIKYPADANGVRPQVTYTYDDKYAWYKNDSGTLVQAANPVKKLVLVATCRTLASCDGNADETISTITYQVGSSAAVSNLLPISQSVGSGTPNSAPLATTSFGYDAAGNLTLIDGPAPGTADTSVIYYDNLRRAVGVISADPDGSGALPNLARRTNYRADGLVTSVEQGTTAGQSASAWAAFSNVSTVTNSYDGNLRLISQKQKFGANDVSLVHFGYDSAGRVQCQTLRMNPAAFGSLPSDACALGAEVGGVHDRVTRFTYDLGDHRTSVRTGFGTTDEVVEYLAYNPNGTVQTVLDGEGNRTSYTYDGFDRLTRMSLPSVTKGSGTTAAFDAELYDYDKLDRLISLTKREGLAITFDYDRLGRVTLKHVPERNGLNATYTRDVYYSYDLQGRLLSARFDSGTGQGITNSYDALGRLKTQTTAMDATWTMAYEYDAAGNRTHITHPDGTYFQMGYDSVHRMSLAWWHSAAGGYVLHSGFNYDAAGRRVSVSRANSATYYGYDGQGRLNAQVLAFAQNSAASNVTESFGYNAAGQLTSRARDNDAYAWTAAKNADRAYTSNGLNQYGAAGTVSFGNDANGNLAWQSEPDNTNALKTKHWYYDVENRMVAYYKPDSTSPDATLRYDPLGRLYEVNGAGTGITRFVYDGDNIAVEYGSDGLVKRRYMWGPDNDEPIVWDEGSQLTCGTGTRFPLRDRQGSVVAAANCAGNVVYKNSYDESGVPQLDANGNNLNTGRFQYTGQAWLPELGMYSYKARMYSPTLGRFMQTDPIGYGDGMNWYNYVGSDPVNGTDPEGLGLESIACPIAFCNVYFIDSRGTWAPGGPSSIGADGTVIVDNWIRTLVSIPNLPTPSSTPAGPDGSQPAAPKRPSRARAEACKVLANADEIARALLDPGKVLENMDKIGVSQNERNNILGAAIGLIGGEKVTPALARFARIASGGTGATLGESAALAARTRGVSIIVFAVGGIAFGDEIGALQKRMEKFDRDFRKSIEQKCRGW